MEVTNDKVVVLRAGQLTKDSIRNGAERVDTIDKVYGLSVQLTPKGGKQDQATIDQLLKAVPNKHYALTFAGPILKLKGKIKYDPLGNNEYHGLINDITVDELYDIFKINKH